MRDDIRAAEEPTTVFFVSEHNWPQSELVS